MASISFPVFQSTIKNNRHHSPISPKPNNRHNYLSEKAASESTSIGVDFSLESTALSKRHVSVSDRHILQNDNKGANFDKRFASASLTSSRMFASLLHSKKPQSSTVDLAQSLRKSKSLKQSSLSDTPTLHATVNNNPPRSKARYEANAILTKETSSTKHDGFSKPSHCGPPSKREEMKKSLNVAPDGRRPDRRMSMGQTRSASLRQTSKRSGSTRRRMMESSGRSSSSLRRRRSPKRDQQSPTRKVENTRHQGDDNRNNQKISGQTSRRDRPSRRDRERFEHYRK